MLRLQPSEITLTPDDVREVSERIDNRKRARGKVRLHRGPERSRDDAVTTLNQQWQPSQAEHLSDEAPEDSGSSRPLKVSIRSGLGHWAALPAGDGPPIGGDSSQLLQRGGLSFTRTHIGLPTDGQFSRFHLDGHSDFAQLLQSHTASAPSFPSVIPSPSRIHSRAESNPQNRIDLQPSIGIGSNDRTTVRSRKTIQGTAHHPASTTTFSDPNISRSSSASAAEAAEADLPSPLDTLSQKAALANTRLATRARSVESINPRNMSYFSASNMVGPSFPVRLSGHSRMVEIIGRMPEQQRIEFLSLAENSVFLPNFPGHAVHGRINQPIQATPFPIAPIAPVITHTAPEPDYSFASLPPRGPTQTIARRLVPAPSEAGPSSAVQQQRSSRPPPAPEGASMVLPRTRASASSPLASPRRNGVEFARSSQPPIPPRASAAGRRPGIAGWQRNQENSEEAAMSVLAEEVGGVSLVGHNGDDSQEGVIDDTPPRLTRAERLLNNSNR